MRLPRDPTHHVKQRAGSPTSSTYSVTTRAVLQARFGALVLLILLVPLMLAINLLAGCASRGTGGSGPTSGISGATLVDAGCPVLRTGSPCPDRPIASIIAVTADATGRTVARAATDADGRFRIALAPGRYTVHPRNITSAVVPRAASFGVTVTAGVFTAVTVHFDSGVR